MNGYRRNSRSKNGNIRSRRYSRKSKEIIKCKDNNKIIFHTTNDIRSGRYTSSSDRSYFKAFSRRGLLLVLAEEDDYR